MKKKKTNKNQILADQKHLNSAADRLLKQLNL